MSAQILNEGEGTRGRVTGVDARGQASFVEAKGLVSTEEEGIQHGRVTQDGEEAQLHAESQAIQVGAAGGEAPWTLGNPACHGGGALGDGHWWWSPQVVALEPSNVHGGCYSRNLRAWAQGYGG
ncbi:unnamed protein product [Ilex paraguariensis]|uniref:Uncharacterized protein n=1 Tax=Ilex paraguariensis TaxID=185542 RepID=A0ABC8UR09_9AQUA